MTFVTRKLIAITQLRVTHHKSCCQTAAEGNLLRPVQLKRITLFHANPNRSSYNVFFAVSEEIQLYVGGPRKRRLIKKFEIKISKSADSSN